MYTGIKIRFKAERVNYDNPSYLFTRNATAGEPVAMNSSRWRFYTVKTPPPEEDSSLESSSREMIRRGAKKPRGYRHLIVNDGSVFA